MSDGATSVTARAGDTLGGHKSRGVAPRDA